MKLVRWFAPALPVVLTAAAALVAPTAAVATPSVNVDSVVLSQLLPGAGASFSASVSQHSDVRLRQHTLWLLGEEQAAGYGEYFGPG